MNLLSVELNWMLIRLRLDIIKKQSKGQKDIDPGTHGGNEYICYESANLRVSER